MSIKGHFPFQSSTIYFPFFVINILLIKFMERSKEKKSLSRQSSIIFRESQSDQNNQDQPPILKRRIRKGSKKLKRRILNTMQHSQSSIITNFFNSQPELFNTSKQESLTKLVKTLKSEVHVRQILAREGKVFPNIRIGCCQEQAKNYFELLKNQLTSQCYNLGIYTGGLKISIYCLKNQQNPNNDESTSLHFLSSSEAFLRSQRQKVMQNIQSHIQTLAQEMGYPVTDIPYFNLQLLTLCKMAKKVQHQVLDRLSWTLVQQDPLFGCHQMRPPNSQTEIKNRYITLLVLKNIPETFKEQPIDFYNYHLTIEHRENHMQLDIPCQQITTLCAFRKYILARKPKSHKSATYFLRTPCSACLSNFSQLANPIENCPECHIRIHRYCQKVESRCHRCRYGRTSNAEKNQTNFCYICNRPREKGLMIQTVTNCSPHQYAHVFCLFLSKLWNVENQEIRGEYMPEEPGQWQCKFCGVHDGLYASCSKCGTLFHGMCAYFEGCSFQFQKENPPTEKSYSILINCCTDSKKRYRLSMQRRFKINLQKLIFREDEELFNYIQSHRKEYP